MQIVRSILGPIQTNVYYVFNPETKEGVIIDPAAEAETIEKVVSDEGFTPKAIFLTHGHFDHISAANEIRSFYGIKICALDKEKDMLADPAQNGDAGFLKQNVRVVPDVFWHDGEEFECLGETWKVIWTPGHTPGGCCLYIPDEKVVFVGDTLFRGSYGRYDLAGGSFPDIEKSLKEKIFALPDDVVAFPGHMEETTIGFEKKNNAILYSSY